MGFAFFCGTQKNARRSADSVKMSDYGSDPEDDVFETIMAKGDEEDGVGENGDDQSQPGTPVATPKTTQPLPVKHDERAKAPGTCRLPTEHQRPQFICCT